MVAIIVNIKSILEELKININDNLIDLTIKTCIRQITERLNRDITRDQVVEKYDDVITELVLEEVINLSRKLTTNGAISVSQGARSITYSDIKAIDYAEKIKTLIPTFVRLY